MHVDFRVYNLEQLNAIVQVLDLLTDDMPDMDNGFYLAECYHRIARRCEQELAEKLDMRKKMAMELSEMYKEV